MAIARPAARPDPAPIPFIDLQAQRRRIAGEIDRAMARVLDHGQYIMGPEVAACEEALAAFCGARQAVSCANGTDALVLVLMAEDVGPGEAVFVPSFTFVATAEAVALRRATPYFVDVRADTFNMDAASLERAIAAAQAAGERPRMVIAVDLFGRPADYEALKRIADRHGLTLVADAAQSFGASRHGLAVGTLADYTTTSFFPAKPLGCYGDGGAVLTDSEAAAQRLRALRMHGQGKDKYDNVLVGLNSRLDTLQAAILIEKLRIFPDEIAARNAVASRYGERLAEVVRCPASDNETLSVWAQYTVVLPDGVERERVRRHCQAQGVPTAIYYPIPLHRQTGYAGLPGDPQGLPCCDHLAERVLSLPMHPYLDEATQDRVVAALVEALGS